MPIPIASMTDTPGLNWNRTEEHLSYTAHANANGIGSSNIQTQPHRVVTAAMRRPTDARPDRSPIPSLPPAPRPVPARVRTGTSVDELMEQHAGMYHHFQRIMDQVLNRRLQMVDDQQSLLNDMMAWEDYRSQLDHTLTRPMFEGDRPPPRHHLLHNHNHNPGGRDRSPSIFGDMLQRLDFFDGAPPAATEAEMERERNAIETKPVVTRPGFTKTIDPNTVIACPLCTKEFGHESDKMPKLWVIVGCGHVVCGPCAEEIFITRKAIKGSTTTRSGSNSGRRMSLSRKTKGKGKAKWSPGPADMDEDATARKETGGEDESLDGAISDGIAPSPTSPASTARTITTTMGPNVKVIKKVMGACPGCQRKIKRTSLQQLYL
ncbi:hypothetical protein BGX33_010343 [Mortierella sp. NVP41]|nr:hypothetical protein BGX33_010343 [Mortierella sp. NVP41]